MPEYGREGALLELGGIVKSGLMVKPPLNSLQHGGLAAVNRIRAYIESTTPTPVDAEVGEVLATMGQAAAALRCIAPLDRPHPRGDCNCVQCEGWEQAQVIEAAIVTLRNTIASLRAESERKDAVIAAANKLSSRIGTYLRPPIHWQRSQKDRCLEEIARLYSDYLDARDALNLVTLAPSHGEE